MKKLSHSYDHREEFELAPGLIMTICFEGDNGLPEVVDGFLRRKASIGEVRKALKARGSLKYPDRMISPRREVINLIREVE